MVTIHRPQAAWPGILDAEVPLALPLHFVPFLINKHGYNTEEWEGCTTGFLRPGIGQRGNHVGTCLCLPPGVNNGAAAVSNYIVVPPPGLQGLQTWQRRNIWKGFASQLYSKPMQWLAGVT
eukprot:GHUV01050660.1.p1 GENE.GHUV01050660.1~~GHUV01050660.1.p1  ORF type:complete len:121 (+),score=7.13 GHUV01050660.1:119-481(+)